MKYVVFALALLFSGSAFSNWIAKRGDEWVRITDKPCNHPAIQPLLGIAADVYMSGHAFIAGQVYQLCWAPTEEGAYLVFEDGDFGFVPKNELHRDGV